MTSLELNKCKIKQPISIHQRATIFELPSNISTMIEGDTRIEATFDPSHVSSECRDTLFWPPGTMVVARGQRSCNQKIVYTVKRRILKIMQS